MKYLLIVLFSFSTVLCKAQYVYYNDSTIAAAKKVTLAQINGKYHPLKTPKTYLKFAKGVVKSCSEMRENLMVVPMTCTKNGNAMTAVFNTQLTTVVENTELYLAIKKLTGVDPRTKLTAKQKQKLVTERTTAQKQIRASIGNVKETKKWEVLRVDKDYFIVKDLDKGTISNYFSSDKYENPGNGFGPAADAVQEQDSVEPVDTNSDELYEE